MFGEDHHAAGCGFTRTVGKSRTTTFSMASENLEENSRWFGWLAKAVKSSCLLKVIMRA